MFEIEYKRFLAVEFIIFDMVNVSKAMQLVGDAGVLRTPSYARSIGAASYSTTEGNRDEHAWRLF